jgi:uncharacterized protein involved in cysteine biosynthesis
MKPVYWLLLAEISFFYIYVSSIVAGISYLLIPDATLNLFAIFALIVAWLLNDYITYIFVKNKVTAEDLLGES